MATVDTMTPETELPWPIEMLSPSDLHPAKRNARTHSKRQICTLADSIARFGNMTPVVLDAQGRICAGHARVEAAKLLGMKLIPVIRATHLNETETRAFALADNKIASMAEWDREILATEIGELQIILPEIGTDIAVTGFDAGEVDSLMIDFADQSSNPADEIPELGDNATARTGDLFNLEKHRLLVGDARDEGSYTRLMRTEKASAAAAASSTGILLVLPAR
jgi:ParB-like chromosome segregation protein Spo0J